MIEVKRISVFMHGPNKKVDMVEAAHFDRVTAERDALQALLTAADEENDALKHWRDLALQFDKHRMKALWHLKTLLSDRAHYDAAAAFLAEPPIPASELQQRADVLEGLLREAYEHVPGYVDTPTELWRRIDAALKPPEGSKPPTCTWSHFDALSWSTACGTSFCFNEDGPPENGMRFCHSCGKALVVEIAECGGDEQ